MNRKIKRSNQNKLNLYVDMGIFILFVILSAPQATGVVLHEWLSLLFVVPFLIHILLHWSWVKKVTGRFLRKLPGETRFNYFCNLVLFVLMTMVTFSGFLVSEALLPSIGIPVEVDRFWFAAHDVTANLLLALMGVHMAMHWGWIARTVKRYILFMPSRQPEIESEGLR